MSLTTGLGTTAISFLIVIAFSAHWHGTRWFGRLRRLLSPLLSVPHVAIAIGFAFLIAPSGWIYRVLAALGLAAGLPPDLSTVQDRHGLALILGLILKEVPFLLLMMLVALGQVRVGESLTIARALGHSRSAAWQAIVLPQLYPQLRLPIYAVLAYSASVVDVALILGPTTPPSLAVLVWRGFHDPDLNQIFWASAGACLQLLIALFAILLWRLGELVASASGRRRIVAGWPGRPSRIAASAAFAGAALVVAAAMAGLAATLLWSFTKSWTIGSAIPEALTLATWMQQLPVALKALTATAVIGISSAMAALLLTIALLEEERRESLKARQRHYWLLYAPLLLPQI
ncbi:MAG TPA: ABC transporter permease, partial [Candidatus Polarisedimenticolia bacterium]|nr:ABC transporter permease [Candidatus Polarisedimenticolia bacterium]